MNLKNIFNRNPSEPTSSNEERTVTDAVYMPEGIESDSMPVNDNQPADNSTDNDRWYDRDDDRLEEDITYMSENYPDFTLRILDDPDSSLNGSLCWYGVVKPQVMEDMEWEIIVVYQGLGGGKGDWSGAMSIYLADPSYEQVSETLGYNPGGFRKDADGAYTLSDHCFGGIRSAMETAILFCTTIEKMCKGEIREDYLSGDSLHLPPLA